MGRFIDETAAKKCLVELMERRGWKSVFSRVFSALDIEELLSCVPTVEDAVEVVRCKDCKHWGDGYTNTDEFVNACSRGKYYVGANGYCVYGERREDNA